MKLVVGLGNPGREYSATRHNVGFEMLDALATRLGLVPAPGEFDRQARSKFEGLALDGMASLSSGTEKVLLLKPLTYMNLSGKAVQAALAFYQMTPADCLVVLDDMALPCGKIRVRPGGSNGGHNGLRDIELKLGTMQYPRLRLGIDTPPPRVPWADYVLGRMSEEQRGRFLPALARGVEATLLWMDKGIDAAMNRYNVDETTKPET